jgi:hypothetical protein
MRPTKHDIALAAQGGILTVLVTALASEEVRKIIAATVPREYHEILFASLGLVSMLLQRYVSRTNPDGGPVAAPYVPEEKRTVVRSRADRHNNPTAFTTDLARQAGLREGIDYVRGDPFVSDGRTYYTARLIGDPLELTIRVIDRVGFLTATGRPRWSHTVMAKKDWDSLSREQKVRVIASMYRKEGGTELAGLFGTVPGADRKTAA